MKNESKHTQGPWTASGPLGPTMHSDPDNAPQWVTAKHTVHIWVAPCSDGFVRGQNIHNARLIAAAPDYDDLIRQIVRDYESTIGRKDALFDKRAEDFSVAVSVIMPKLRAAISKAEGK